ncbi:uncharacterized protein L3040_003303 [Drepanopeziza brunnea f. sp. 'multigermtubi']|nr:hypothetical protein L3040_003303 [Drepanopeziza brunnea f. sp. 'multigermtubi']
MEDARRSFSSASSPSSPASSSSCFSLQQPETREDSTLSAPPLDPVHPLKIADTDHARSGSHFTNSSLAIRSRAETLASNTSSSSLSSPVRRKPLPATASPLVSRFSTPEYLTAKLYRPNQPFVRPFSVDSPTLHEFPPTPGLPYIPAELTQQKYIVSTALSNEPVALTAATATPPDTGTDTSLPNHQTNPEEHIPIPNLLVPSPPPASDYSSEHVRLTSEASASEASTSGPWNSDSSSASYADSSMFSRKPTPQDEANVTTSRGYSTESDDSSATPQKPLSSPGASKLGSFFGWRAGNNPSPGTEKALANRTPPATDNSKAPARNIPGAIDVPKANSGVGGYFGSPYLQPPPTTPATPIPVAEMEKELKEISSELASSIRREMDLEDLVERLQSEALNPSPTTGKRTSDYFSDSGTSSVRYGDQDSKQDELDRMLRKAEQEKALMSLELTTKVQDERDRRKHLEVQIRELEERASQVDLSSMNSMDASGRLRDLEATCEDLRRRLAEERQLKDNFEDLLVALKGELQSSHNERDNLRDEIVPGLRARVEGLEAQAAEHERLTYEQSKMQQELQSLKNENLTLINAQRLQMEMQQQMTRFNAISEEATPSTPSSGLFRSNSVAQATGLSKSRPASLRRSTSVKNTESRDSLVERVKDVELQRDALHKALQSLLERQEHQNREHQKKIRQLELERDRALSSSPRRMGYDKEVAHLRQEINSLRRRADDAIEQKWQCEKGLSGLKMDLDRAEQEIGSLKTLLGESDILVPTGPRERGASGTVSSEALERSYKELQKAYRESLDRVKNLEAPGSRDKETERAMSELEQSLADAMSERDFARREAESLRGQSESLREGEMFHMGNEAALAEELRGSAKRVEELAIQVRQQLAANAALRQRLSETIERGEKEQRANAEKIMFMQRKLKSLEDQLMLAQQTTEEKVSRHENEIRGLKESHNVQLQRIREGIRSPRRFEPHSPISQLFAGSTKAPQLISTTSGTAMTVSEDSKMEFLKQKVGELEAALVEADRQMEEVVGRMNIAQIQVMELQNEREEAVRETKRLQHRIEQEKARALEVR